MSKRPKILHSTLIFLMSMVMISHGVESSIDLPDLPVLKEEGKADALGTMKKEDEILVLVFAATTCPVCSVYWKRIKGCWYNYRDKKVRMIVIGGNTDDKYEELRKTLEKTELELPVVWDAKHLVASKLGLDFTPSVAVISRDWKPLYIGRIDDCWRDEDRVKNRYLEDAIGRALEDKKSSAHVNENFCGSKMR